MLASRNTTGILSRRIVSLRCAFAGIGYLVQTQVHARVHLAATALAVAAGMWLRVSRGDWCWLIVAICGVWMAEGLNTAVELLADALHPQQHPVIGRAKDVAAGAVLIASVAAVGIGMSVFLPRL